MKAKVKYTTILSSGTYNAGDIVDVDEKDITLASLEPVSKKDKDAVEKRKAEAVEKRKAKRKTEAKKEK